jgi:hypothetical protein
MTSTLLLGGLGYLLYKRVRLHADRHLGPSDGAHAKTTTAPIGGAQTHACPPHLHIQEQGLDGSAPPPPPPRPRIPGDRIKRAIPHCTSDALLRDRTFSEPLRREQRLRQGRRSEPVRNVEVERAERDRMLRERSGALGHSLQRRVVPEGRPGLPATRPFDMSDDSAFTGQQRAAVARARSVRWADASGTRCREAVPMPRNSIDVPITAQDLAIHRAPHDLRVFGSSAVDRTMRTECRLNAALPDDTGGTQQTRRVRGGARVHVGQRSTERAEWGPMRPTRMGAESAL